MSRFVLPLQTVSDGYTYFSCPNTQFVTVQVFNNGVDIGYGQGISGRQGSAMYPPADEYLALQTATLPRVCDEIRFKNHVPGQAAQIQVTTQGTDDLPSGNPLAVGISPNFLTVNSDGTVGATFTGLIQALGLKLPSYVGSPPRLGPVTNSVQWQRQSDGAAIASITGSSSPLQEGLEITSLANPATDQSYMTLFAGDANANPPSVNHTLFRVPGDPTNTNESVTVTYGLQSFVARILNGLGQSDFLKNAFLGDYRCKFDAVTTLSWPGAQQAVDYIYSHGQPTPINVSYYAAYINVSGTIAAFPCLPCGGPRRR